VWEGRLVGLTKDFYQIGMLVKFGRIAILVKVHANLVKKQNKTLRDSFTEVLMHMKQNFDSLTPSLLSFKVYNLMLY
jgi:mannose/fructose/N-acetylgalactosamine-specific phosphotransferase system component IID